MLLSMFVLMIFALLLYVVVSILLGAVSIVVTFSDVIIAGIIIWIIYKNYKKKHQKA